MRLRAPNVNIPPWLEKGLLGLFLLAVSPIIAAVAAMLAVVWLKRWLIGPRKDWSRWFAWHPVTVQRERGRSESRWLEMVERKSWGVLADIHKRPIGGTWEPASW